MTPNPACVVNSLPTPQDIASGASFTGGLADPTGARFWGIQCTSCDELTSVAAINATLVVDQVHKTFSCTGPAGTLGRCMRFQSQVGIEGLGLDANGEPNPDFTTTFLVNVPTSGGDRVLAFSEKMEQDPVFGWIVKLNRFIRSGGGGGGFPPSPVQGDILYYNGTAWTALAPGTPGQFLKTNGASANPQWAAAGGGSTPSFVQITSDVSTTSTAYADLLSLTLTTTGTNLLVQWSMSGTQSSGGSRSAYGRILLDGTLVNNAGAFATAQNTFAWSTSNAVLITGLSPGSHTVKLQWKTDSGGDVLIAASTDPDTEHANLLVTDLP